MGLGAIGLIGTVAATGIQMYGQNQQAKAAGVAADYNNQLAQREADNREAGTAEAIKRQRMNNRAGLADLRTRMAAGGVQTNTGTSLLLAGETAGRMEVAIADAARSAGMQAESLRAQGKMGLWEAEQTADAAKLSMISTGISGLSNAYGKFQEGKYQGLNYRIGGR